MIKLTKRAGTEIQRTVDLLCTAKEAQEILGIRSNKTFYSRMKKGLFGDYTYVGGYFIVFLRKNIMRVKDNPNYFIATEKWNTARTRQKRLSKKEMSDWIKSVIYSDI